MSTVFAGITLIFSPGVIQFGIVTCLLLHQGNVVLQMGDMIAQLLIKKKLVFRLFDKNDPLRKTKAVGFDPTTLQLHSVNYRRTMF
jgi:hypothetical protein